MKSKLLVFALDHKSADSLGFVKKYLEKILTTLKIKGVGLEVYLVGDKLMPKNVLAFPNPNGFPRPDFNKLNFLGQIYLNPTCIKRQYQGEYAPQFALNICGLQNPNCLVVYMLIHGVFHLLGYDHKRKSDRIVMEKKEGAILATLFK